jgi:hypothetical protein
VPPPLLSASIINITDEDELVVKFSSNITVPNQDYDTLNKAIDVYLSKSTGDQ